MALTKFNFNSFDVTSAASKGLAFNSSANGFEIAAEGSMTLIKTLTASSSSTLSFVDGSSDVVLDNTYPVYVFKIINAHPSVNGAEFRIQGSTDSGSNYNTTMTSNAIEVWHAEDDSTYQLQYSTYFDKAQTTDFFALSANPGNENNESFSGTFTIFNPSSTTFVKNWISEGDTHNHNDSPIHTINGGYFNTASALDAFQFKMSSGTFDGTVKLYGIKDS